MPYDANAFAKLQRDVEALSASLTFDATAFNQLQRDVERLFERVRLAETAASPVQRAYVEELKEVHRRVETMDLEGTHVTQVRLKHIEEDIREMKEDQKSLRVTIRSALITATLSLGVQLILFAILRTSG